MRGWSQNNKDDNHRRHKLICLVSFLESSSVNEPIKLVPEGLQLLHIMLTKKKVLIVYNCSDLILCFLSWNCKR